MPIKLSPRLDLLEVQHPLTLQQLQRGPSGASPDEATAYDNAVSNGPLAAVRRLSDRSALPDRLASAPAFTGRSS